MAQEESISRELRCFNPSFFDLLSNNKPINEFSHSIKEQINTEESVKMVYEEYLSKFSNDPDYPMLNKEHHIKFLIRGLRNLPSSFECLDSSRPWICYWILHSLYLLDANLSDDLIENIINFLNSCQSNTGGFGGGPGQLPHLATTYAAVNALCTLNTDNALKCIRTKELAEWIKRLKLENGAFRMHEDGEEDLRGTYCAITVAKICNLEKMDPNLFENSAEWVLRCQTYEGGFGATPENEAHGGYGFCGIASLKLLGKEHLCDIDALTYWLVNKQMKFEGGFQGRTNKLVDSCYSFWQGGMFPIIHSILIKVSLQEYILLVCQVSNGGVIDKPGKNRDYYHTCYALSGLSVSQYFRETVFNICSNEDSLLNRIHPLFNIGYDLAFKAIEFFSRNNSIDLLDIDT